jgi:hypothetical protein
MLWRALDLVPWRRVGIGALQCVCEVIDISTESGETGA